MNQVLYDTQIPPIIAALTHSSTSHVHKVEKSFMKQNEKSLYKAKNTLKILVSIIKLNEPAFTDYKTKEKQHE